MRLRITFMLLVATLAYASAAPATESDGNKWRHGIWKSTPPAHKSKAAFHAQDPYALAYGYPISVDCSIDWIYARNGRLYCFDSLTSKAYFMRNPQHYIHAAQAFLEQRQQ